MYKKNIFNDLIKKISILLLLISFFVLLIGCPPPRPREVDTHSNNQPNTVTVIPLQ